MKLQNWFLLSVCLLVVGCAQNRLSANWPAQIVGFQNFTSEQQSQMLGFVNDMNQMSEQALVQQSNNPNGYPVTISLVTAPASQPLRAGFTVRQDSNCSIQISDFLYTQNDAQYLESVFMHEFGHCAGLVHVSDPQAIMYPTTAAFTSYSQNEFSSFFQSFTSSMETSASGAAE